MPQDLENYVQQQGPGVTLTVDAVREFEVLTEMSVRQVSACSNTSLVNLATPSQLTAFAAS